MSEGDVSLIRDEDVLRRMWQQTEDFSRKKEIRAHMYRLREERLRSLYSPEPSEAKGCEFSSTQGHVQSFADQTFQSMKSKEVRDAGSPPKEFTYRGQDLKELSNAGWNVESENRTTDDGHTHEKTVNANIEGRYDVEGGKGQFAAVDQHRQAVTEYHDDNSSLKKNETASNTAAREHVVRQTDDGTQISSTTSSSTSTSKFQQVSSTKHETVPYLTNDDYDRQQSTYDTNSNQEYTRRQVNQTEEFERNLRKSDVETGELISRKIDYPDDNTRVVVETRCLPDGTRVTSTRREFRGTPVVQKHSEQHSQQTRNETKSSYSSTQKSSDVRESSSKIIRDSNDNRYTNIVDSQKNVDNVDFKRNQTEYIVTEDNQSDQNRQTSQKRLERHYYEPQVRETYQPEITSTTTTTKYSKNDTNEQDFRETKHTHENKPQTYKPDNSTTTVENNQNVINQDVSKTYIKDNTERIHHTTTEDKIDETVERKVSSDQYQTTYQSDFTQKKKISNDWSPTHQAWASTLRADTPSTTRPSTRASSPGGKTYQSSTSSLRSSVSPDKTFRKPSSRGGSPSKVDRYSPTRSMYSSTHSTHSLTKTNRHLSPEGRPPSGGSPTRHSPEKKPHDSYRQRPSLSPEKRPYDSPRYSTSPEKKVPHYQRPTESVIHHTTLASKDGTPPRYSASPERNPSLTGNVTDDYPKSKSPIRPTDQNPISSRCSQTPERKQPYEDSVERRPLRPIISPDRQPVNKVTESYSRSSPDRKPGSDPSAPRGGSTDRTPHIAGTKRTPSPEKPVHHKSSPSQPSPSTYPRYTSPTRPLDGKYSPEHPSNKTEHPKSPTKESSSPDKITGYMKPTGVNKQSPTKSPSPDRKSNRTTKVTEDHYKFIDEETKMYTRKDEDFITTKTQSTSYPATNKKATSPNKNVTRDSPDHCRPESPTTSARPTLRKDSRSPSPPKGPVTFTQDRLDTKNFTEYHTEDKYTENIKNHNIKKESPITSNKDIPIREPSPSKYGTYDKKQRQSKEYDETETDDTRYDTFTRREKSSSPRKSPNIPSSPTKKSPRESLSPVKPGKDSKYKHTTDFISTERTTEQMNKTTKLERPRQLVTPSTSPTRKPKTVETAPSTGQSSPTTSVSGFVYFSSPRTESTTIVTDLDEQEYHYEIDRTDEKTMVYKRPDSLDVKRSPSPSKIPCRSSPQEKSPASSLPRKSSLKKPSKTVNQISPVEKPPSSFQVSPTSETPSNPEHKIVKKDHPEKGDIPAKAKPPLERRETYDERCRKILGMIDDGTSTTTSTVTCMDTLRLREHDSNASSPSISPCRSPREEIPSTQVNKDQEIGTKVTTTDVNVTEFLNRETQDSINNIRTDVTKKYQTPSREQSPTKLQDIITRSTKVTDIDLTSTCDVEDVTTKTSRKTSQNVTKETPSTRNAGSTSPTRRSPEKRLSESPERKPSNQRPKERKPNVASQPRTPSPIKPTQRENISPQRTITDKPQTRPQQPTSDKTPTGKDMTTNNQTVPKKDTKAPNHLRTPSPTKKATVVTENSTDFLMSEREQEILDRVQKSLRKLSPNRKEKSPSRERSPSKNTTSLQDIDITTTITDEASKIADVFNEFEEINEAKTQIRKHLNKSEIIKPIEEKVNEPSSKPSSRNVSPVKKSPTTPIPKLNQSPTSPTKPRSTSPKKLSTNERPQSPQTPKASGIKPRETIPSHLTRKQAATATSPTKGEKTITTTDTKKIVKQNSLTKINTMKSTTNKFTQPATKPLEPDNKRVPTSKGIKESPRKDVSPVSRTPSDNSPKPKKISPQRMRSKPEIQVNDISTSKRQTSTNTTTTKTQKSTMKEPQSRLPSKPKSATALNTSTDEDDIIIDVQQAKSSRENSPDRICPTPVGFNEDLGTPRFPDEVSEPDDEFRKRTYHTIHEAESIVDDIVEICEDDELFVKQTNVDRVTGSDECLLSVNDKVSKFTNKVDSVKKPKTTTSQFKDTERRVHSDFVTESLKSDECLLSVSEKVNKFAKGPRDTKDSKSPSRRIVDEFDTETVYQDDYTKLSVNDKAHLFVETAENVNAPKVKPSQKIERPDLSNVDESLKSDDCLLSVSDKVNKFVKTAEQFLGETIDEEEKERKIKEQHDKIMKKIVDITEETQDSTKVIKKKTDKIEETFKGRKSLEYDDEHLASFTKETASSHAKLKDSSSPNLKPTERTPTVKITTLRSSEAVKKAKALFENIATSTQQKTKDVTLTKTAKLIDIGVMKKSPKTDSTVVLPPSSEDVSPNVTDIDSEVDGVPHKSHPVTRPSIGTPSGLQPTKHDERPKSPSRLAPQPTGSSRTTSPMRQVETLTTTKTVISRYPSDNPRGKSPKPSKDVSEKSEKPQDQVPGYLRPTITSQTKEETKVVEETEVSSRRGSGKFGVELRRTSVERSTISSERRRSVEHPCIEDIFDLDLLEQMLEKVVGYEQRRRIRSQIRVAKKKLEEQTETNIQIRTTKQTTVNNKHKSPERLPQNRSPERKIKSTPQKTSSPQRTVKTNPQKPYDDIDRPRDTASKPTLNGHAKETVIKPTEKPHRPLSPEKPAPKSTARTKSPVRHPSPEKKTRPLSPSKIASPKTKQNRFNEYASAYMKKVGLNEADKIKFTDTKTKKITEAGEQKILKRTEERKTLQTKQSSTTARSTTERSSSKDTIEIVTNGKRSPSPDKKRSPERQHEIIIETRQRSPSPILKRQKSDSSKKETIIKTVYDIEKKVTPKPTQEEKPSWVTNRNLKKITSETRTFSSKKIEPEKPKYRAPSPSKVISKPLDVITSSYGPGPLDAEGRPLFGIKALRNGASNYQVKGTVIRQEFHSRNGGEPEGSVSVTAYSSSPEELERLLATQGERPSRLHGLAAITTTKKFGGDTGTSYKEAHTKEERAALEQFTHQDRRVSNSRVEIIEKSSDNERLADRRGVMDKQDRVTDRKTAEREERGVDKKERVVDRRGVREEERRERVEKREDRKTVRQSSVKSLTEKYIKSASESSKTERSAYPKAGLILRTATMKDSISSDSSAHAGLARTDSEHSLASEEDVITDHDGRTVTTTDRDGRTVTTITDRDGRTVTTTTDQDGRVVTTTRSVREERSFLDSSTKVSGVQDILTRMKNADIVIQEGDTTEDSEARALLNKFLGATVLMAGMQNYVNEQPTGRVVVKQETVRSGGRVSSNKRLEEVDIDSCWDERVLRKLLDECSDYEQRRRLRARIRALMAEQEACASAVTEALAAAGETTEGDSADARGESLLLPLLQGLLGSGSERLLAGLGSAGADVVADVRRSLARLRAALAPPADHPQARALLTLADRLEDALDAADRLDGCRTRKPRRRSRANRHTVGVTHEELAEARRLVDRDQLSLNSAPEPQNISSGPASTVSGNNSVENPSTPERKPSIDENVSYHDAVASRQKQAPIAHSASFASAPVMNRDTRIVERRVQAPKKPDFFRHSMADGVQPQPQPQPQPQLQHREERRPSKSGIAAIANKFNAQVNEATPSFPVRRAPVARSPPPVKTPVAHKQTYEEPKPIPNNRNNYKPLPPTYNFAAPPPVEEVSKPLNRFSNNKRLRMKRANTIDIGRPLAGYKIDSDTDEEGGRGPLVPEFHPQTENDRKFVAFMRKNQENEQVTVNGQTNWSNRFGNIKNAFESRERDDNSRSSSASSAKHFWRAAEESPRSSYVPRPRKFLNDVSNSEVIRPPWAQERRESMRVHIPPPPPAHTQTMPPTPPAPLTTPPAPLTTPPAPLPPVNHPPPIPQSPTRPLAVKQFVAKPIPVNQFSHAPMSAFKPPTKIVSPTTAPTLVWSPPSLNNTLSPTGEAPLSYPIAPKPIIPSPKSPVPSVPWATTEYDKPRRVVGTAAKFETPKYEASPPATIPPYRERTYATNPPTPPTHAPPQIQNFPVKSIPSQNNLAAPELVKKIDVAKPAPAAPCLPKVDAQKLQIEFYEKQIRQRHQLPRHEPTTNGHYEPNERKPPPPPAYTVTDYTPSNVVSTFVPLQQTPDIEKARAHKIDYLPDVVMNENDRQEYQRSPTRPQGSPYSPRTKAPAQAYQNGDVAYTNGTDSGPPTEHGSVVTRVMRGPVRGAATITAGARTRHDHERRAADNLRGALDKLSFPKREVPADRKKTAPRSQVRAPVQNGPSPQPAHAQPRLNPDSVPPSPGGRSPALAASRESVLSSESAASAGSSPLSRSGSWHQLAERSPQATSPRRVMNRTKSMHLLGIPKLYEGGITRDELTDKKRTVEAYFSGQTSSKSHAASMRARSNRSTQQSYSLGRSRTMPTVSELQFLDESNADDAFEDLVSALA